MNTAIRTTIERFSMALGAVCFFGMSLQAQTFKEKAQVPFNFQVARTILPAGDYCFENTSYPTVAQIRNLKTGRQIYVPVSAATPVAHSQLRRIVFHLYGNEAFLAEIRTTAGLSSKVPTSRREKELMLGSRPVAKVLVPLAVRAD